MKRPKRSPWGPIDHWREIAPGIAEVGTPGHGGIKLSRGRNARIPADVRRKGGWYEEDVDWSIVAVFFPEAFSPDEVKQAASALKNYHPEAFTMLTGNEVKPHESRELRRRRFEEESAGRFVVHSAYGSWHERVPEGYVGVVARRDDGAEGWWLVSSKRYRQSREFGYVIPEHEEDDREPVHVENTKRIG